MSKIRRTNKNIVKFDGTGDKIIVANSSDRSKLSFGQDGATEKPFSISAWVFIADVSADASASNFAGIADTGNNNHEYIFARTSQDELLFWLYSNADAGGVADGTLRCTSTGSPFSDATWFHVIGTYDGSKNVNGIKLYVDGALIASNGEQVDVYTRMHSHDTTFSIGGYTSNNGYFEDKMADVCIFDKELTATEVAEIYNSGKVKDMRRASTYNNLISWWKMGDDQDSSLTGGIKDYKGVNHGTLQADAVIREDLSLDTDLESDPRTAGIHIHQSFGRTRTPKSPLQYTQNLVGNSEYIIPYATAHAGDNVFDIANIRKNYGLATENQRHMHLLIDSTTISSATKTASVGVLGYTNAFGIWSQLIKQDLPSSEPQTSNKHQVIHTDTIDNNTQYFVFDILGVDKVLFYAANENASTRSDWQLRVAFSTF